MVTEAAPNVAVDEAANVTVLVVVVDAGLKAAVTPEGNPLAVRATLLENPPAGATVITLVALEPRFTVTDPGFGVRLKSGAATVSPTVVVWLRLPLVPVIVTVADPRVAVLLAVRVRLVLLPVVGVGLNAAVTPVGKPLAVKATLPVKPPVRVMVIVLLPLPPRAMLTLAGLADSEKSGAATVKLIVVVCVSPPPVAVIVTVAAPSVAVLDAASVTVLLAPVVDAGLKLAVTPAGSPLADNATLLANPPVRAIDIVSVPLAPRLTVRLAGLEESEKSGVAAPGSP
jgi:hypothetical protein